MQLRDKRLEGGRAVIASRAATGQTDSTEIERLATAAGYDVVDVVTQRRREDAGTWLGRGKAEELADRASKLGADTVVVDGDLSPGQYANFVDVLAPGVGLVDRYRLVLDVFADGAADRRASLQVRAATLRYELPRLRQVTDESLLNRATEKGSPVLDAERRIDRLETKLDDLSAEAAERRDRRRAGGVGLVAIAGYTNAGKTTLFHRLADDLSVDDRGPSHPDLKPSAPTADRPFATLETVTRRSEIDGRDVLYTDTVGLIEDLPHDLVDSFSATLDEVVAADVVVLVVDATDDPERVREKARVARDAFGQVQGDVVGVLNKVDGVDALDDRIAAVREFVPEVIATSALDGTGVDRLERSVRRALPGEQAAFRLPNGPAVQEFVSWAHEHGAVETRYDGETVRVELDGRPEIVDRARGRVTDLGGRELDA